MSQHPRYRDAMTERPWWLTLNDETSSLPEDDPAAQPPRDLIEEEHHDLLRRINAPGGAHLRLSADEESHIDKLPPVRRQEQVRQLRWAIAAEPPENEFVSGVADGISYAYGETSTQRGPVSGEPPKYWPPTCGDLMGERAMINRALRGELMAVDNPVPRSRDYMVGVEHCLMWLECRTDDPPWTLSGVEGGRA